MNKANSKTIFNNKKHFPKINYSKIKTTQYFKINFNNYKRQIIFQIQNQT